MKQGRVDEETTLNIGTIDGGTGANIVPGECVCTGEVRSYSHTKALGWKAGLCPPSEEATTIIL